MLDKESIIREAFNALRNPASDPGGFGRGFVLTTLEVNGQGRWVIAAEIEGTIIPLFFALVPGDRVKIDEVDRIVGEGIGPGVPTS